MADSTKTNTPKKPQAAKELWTLTFRYQGGCKYIHNLQDRLDEIGWKPYFEFPMTYWKYMTNREYGPQQEAVKEALSTYKRDDGAVDFVFSKIMVPSTRGDPVFGVQNMLGIHHLSKP